MASTDHVPSEARRPEPIPLTIVTGFLGSGKTTLLNELLKDPALSNSVVLINEFGEIGLDHQLIETVDDGLILLASGCLCCTVRGDLINTLEGLLRKRDNGRMNAFDRIIIETTGLADPVPVLQAVMGHRYLAMRYRLEGVIAVVDAVNIASTLDAHPEAVKQIVVADRLLISKSDLAAEADVQVLCSDLQRLNPAASVAIMGREPINALRLLDCGLYDPDSKRPDVRRWLNEEALVDAAHDDHGHEAQTHHHAQDHHAHEDHHGHGGSHPHIDVNRHGEGIHAFAFRSDASVSRQAFDLFCELLRSAHGPKLLRVKGLVRLSGDPLRPIVVHGAQHVFHPPQTLESWPDDDHATRLVFITQDLDRAFIAGLWAALSKEAA